MNRNNWRVFTVASFLLVAAAVVLLTPSGANAHPGGIVATIKCFPPEMVLPGEVTCIGGTPDPASPTLCSPETKRIQLRGTVLKWTYRPGDVESPRADLFIGNQYTTNNGNYDANFQGNEWGTFVWRDPSGRLVWEGTFETIAFGRQQAQWSAVGHGVGAADGLQWKGDGTFATGQAYGIFNLRATGTAK